MIYHPAIFILISTLSLIIFYKQKYIFNSIAVLMPILAAFMLIKLPETNSIDIFNITLIAEGSSYNKLIAIAFTIVLLAANLYSIGQNKKNEIILGSSYGAFSFFCLLAGDFISMFIGLELMMVVSSIIIFIGGMHASLRSAKKYFLTHLMSSNMIIIGIAYLITKNNDLALVPIAELMHNPEYSTSILSIMLVGMLINIAAFPFSGWMVNYYPKASPSGFLYLISFTTKISIMLIAKLFAGYEMLQYIAIIIIIYASIQAIFEDNLLSLLCYLSIMSMGLMLIGISNGSETIILASIGYLFVHIIYKLLLSILTVNLIDQTGIYNCSELKKVNSKLVIWGTIIGIATMINLPIISSYYIKLSISHAFYGTFTYFIITLLSFLIIFVLPWRQYFIASESFNIKSKKYSDLSILFTMILLIIIGTAAKYLPVLENIETLKRKSFFTELFFQFGTLKQLMIILSALCCSLIIKIKRKPTRAINFTETIGNIIFHSYAIWTKKQPKNNQESEPIAIETLERQMSKYLSRFHNQQTAIFTIFIIFIAMLLNLI